MNTLHEPTGHGIAYHMVSCEGRFVPQDPESMFNVLAQGHDLQVLEPVIGLDPVLVVDGHLRRNPDEGIRNEAVSISRIKLCILAKNDAFISIPLVNVADYDASLMALIALESPQPSHIADLVHGEVSDRSPLLHTCNPTMGYMQ